VVRLHQAGINYAVATLGTATTQEHLHKIFRITSEVVFCFDGDKAGRQAAWRALENALPLAQDGRELKFMFLPDGHDPDTLVAEEGGSGFEARLKDAVPLSRYLIEHLSQQVDLSNVDGRAKLKALAQPLFARMPAGVYRELLADALAAQIHMPAAKLKAMLMVGTPAPSPQKAEPARRNRGRISVGRGNLLTQAIVLVLHHPTAARAIKDPTALESLTRPGIAVLKDLLEQAREAVSPTTAVLLERWRDRPEYHRLADLAQADPLVADAAAATKELAMAVEKLLEEAGPGRRMDELLRKAAETGLNYDEKAELTMLLKSRGQPRAPS
jgi:DNA primase